MAGRSSVLDAAAHWPVHYARGQSIYDEGDPPKAMYRVERGCVRLQVNGLEGHRQIVAFLFPGDLFGFCIERRTASAEAVTDVDLTRFSIQSVLDLSSRSSEVTVELIHTANTLYSDLAHHVELISHLTAAERVLWFLHWLTKHGSVFEDGAIRLPMNRRDISDYLAITPETLSRIFRQLSADGYLKMQGLRRLILTAKAMALRVRHTDELAMVETAA